MNDTNLTRQTKFPTHLDHLNKTFLEEISYKIWTTKGARFNANKRLIDKEKLSTNAIAFLTAYLIIFGLIAVYQVYNNNIISEKIIAFASTTLSILLLVFSQTEAAQDYKIRARSYHECALKLSELYNEIRILKTMKNPTDDERLKFVEEISNKYQNILTQYPNHSDLDFKMFQAAYFNYYGISFWKKNAIIIENYASTKSVYHILISVPLLFIGYLLLLK